MLNVEAEVEDARGVPRLRVSDGVVDLVEEVGEPFGKYNEKALGWASSGKIAMSTISAPSGSGQTSAPFSALPPTARAPMKVPWSGSVSFSSSKSQRSITQSESAGPTPPSIIPSLG